MRYNRSMSNNVKFYIYTAIVFVGVFIYMEDNFIDVDDTGESFPLLAGAFLITFGASCAFLSPIGHQCNTLIMGPGNYKFGDY